MSLWCCRCWVTWYTFHSTGREYLHSPSTTRPFNYRVDIVDGLKKESETRDNRDCMQSECPQATMDDRPWSKWVWKYGFDMVRSMMVSVVVSYLNWFITNIKGRTGQTWPGLVCFEWFCGLVHAIFKWYALRSSSPIPWRRYCSNASTPLLVSTIFQLRWGSTVSL